MALSMYEIRRILNPSEEAYPSDDIRILDSWAEYDSDRNKAPGKRALKYLCYEMETMNPDTGERVHFFKAVKFLKIERLPASARQSTAFMDMQSQILSSVWENGYNLVTVIANIIKPVSIGLLYLYGVQGVSRSLSDAKKQADSDFRGLRASLQGTFRVLEMRALWAEEAEWLRERIYNMKFLTTVRGIPKANRSGEDGGNKGMGGRNVNPDSQGTLEELITGLVDYEYVIEILSTPVYRDTLEGWQRRWQKEMTEWYSRLQGNTSLSMNLSIPMTYMANASQAQGWSRSFNDSTTVSLSQGESFTHTEGSSVGKSLSENYSKGVNYSEGQSYTQNESQGFSITNGINKSHSLGHSVGESFSQSSGFSAGNTQNFSQGANTGMSQGISKGTNVGFSDSESHGINSGINESISHGVSSGINESSSHGVSSGTTEGSSHGISSGINESFSHGTSSGINSSHSTGTSENISESMGMTEGTSHSQTAGVSSGSSYTYGQGANQSTSYGQSVSQSESVGHSQNMGTSYGYNQSQGVSLTNSASVSHGSSQGVSSNVTDSYGTSEGYSQGTNMSNSWSTGGSQQYSQGHTDGQSDTVGGNVKVGVADIIVSGGASYSHGWTGSDSTSSSSGANWSQGGSAGESMGYNAGVTENHSTSSGTSSSVSQSSTQGVSSGYSSSSGISVGANQSQGFSESRGITSGESMGVSAGVSQSESYGSTLGQSFSEGYSNSVGINRSMGHGSGISESSSIGTSQGINDSYSQGSSYGMNDSISHSESNGISDTISKGSSQGTSDSLSQGQSYGTNDSYSQGNSYGYSDGSTLGSSYGQSESRSDGVSFSYSSSASYGTNYSVSESDSYGQSYTEGQSYSQGQSVGQSISNGQSLSYGKGSGQNWGTSESDSQGTSKTESSGRSTGTSLGTTGTSSFGTSTAMGLGPSIGYTKSHQWLDQGVKDLLELMDYQDQRLKDALRQNGAFYTYVYICCPSEECMRAAQAVAKSTWHNPDAMVQPLQVLDLSESEQKHLLHHAAAFSADVTKEYNNGAEGFKYCSVLLPSEYAAYTHLPRVSEGGVFSTIEDIPKFSIPGRLNGEIYMGNILSPERYSWDNGYNTPFDYRIPESSLLHGYFTGASRSGKTVAAMRFIRELSRIRRSRTGKRVRIVVLDPKQDWRKLARYIEPERFRFASMGNPNFNPIRINPWKIPEGVEPQFWIDGVVNIYCRSYGFLERGKQMISEVVFDEYDKVGVFGTKDPATGKRQSVDPADIPKLSANVNFSSIYESFKKKHAALAAKGGSMGNDTKDAYARILERLSAFGREYSKEYKLYGTSEGLGIDELIGNDDVTVLESKGLESTFNNFIFGVIVSGFYKYALGHDGGFLADDQYETVLVVEEANEVLTGNDDSSGKSSSSLKGESEFEQVLDQAAGYGLFIMAITQKIGKMPSSVTANAGIVFTGRLQTPTDVQAAMNALGKDERIDDKDLKKWYPNIPVGWFICKVSRSRDWKSQYPVLVNIAPLPGTVPNNSEITSILTKGKAIRAIKEAQTISA